SETKVFNLLYGSGFMRGWSSSVKWAVVGDKSNLPWARHPMSRAEVALNLAQEHGFPQLRAMDSILRGWALVQQGRAKEGIEQMHQGLTAHRATGAEEGRPYFLSLLAEAHGTLGEPEAGLTIRTEALTLMDTTGERVWEPELYRLKGELLL